MLIGKTLAHYEILAKIGSGGMGDVFRARDTKLGREVALKVLPREVAADDERRERFEREARAIAALNHPSIVTVHSVETDGEVHFITMELVEGLPLTGSIPPEGIPIKRIFEIAIPLSDAIEAAHRKGITHRDLKPDNIMITPEGRVKVLDFGLAKLAAPLSARGDATMTVGDSPTADGRILGTVAYMSPEQAEGKEVDHRSDVFSLGIVLYQMASGRLPFKGDSSLSILTSILRDTPVRVTEIKRELPNHLGRIISRCLAKEPDRRYQSAMEVRNELKELRAELQSQMISGSLPASELTAPPPPRPLPPAAPSAGSKRWVPWAAGAVLLGAVAGAVLLRGGNEAPVRGERTPAAASGGSSSRATIVVFPFENLGAADESYFAAGITEEITSRLARVEGLAVMSRTSAVQYDRTSKTMQQIGEELGVEYVLEGTVRWEKHGEGASRVRVTPQLIRSADDTHVWSDSYDRSMEEIFRVQSEIAERVAENLNVTLNPAQQQSIEAAHTDNVDAWHAFQKAQELEDNFEGTREELELMVQLLERAVSLDPGFVDAYAMLAKTQSAFSHWAIDRSEERLALARAAADKARALSPDSPAGYIALGYYHYWGKKEYEAALVAFGEAQKRLGDDPDVHEALGNVRRRQGRFEEALEHYRRAMAADPRNRGWIFNVAETMRLVGDYAGCFETQARAISLDPGKREWYADVSIWRLEAGDLKAAREIIDSCPAPPQSNLDFTRLFYLEFLSRDYEAALAVVSSMPTELADEQFDIVSRSVFRGGVLAQMGDREGARAAYETARAALEERVRRAPNDARARSELGVAYAGLGRAEDAIREGKRGVELCPPSVDAYIAPSRVRDLATIHVMLKNESAALDLIEQLLSTQQTALTRGWLRLDPTFDSLRDDPRFVSLAGGPL